MTDPIISSLGDAGPWQLWIFALVFWSKFSPGWNQLATVFLAPPPVYHCVDPPDVDRCSESCKKIEFDRSVFTNTVPMEFDLTCDNSYLINLSQTIFMSGILLGNISFGIWSDRAGRRTPFVVAMISQTIVGWLNALVPWFWTYCLFRFLVAFCTGGHMLVSFVLIMEIIGPKYREHLIVLVQVPFNLGHSTLPLFSYFLRDWRYFQFALATVGVTYFTFYCLVPESPRWLMVKGHLDKAEEVLKKGCTWNGRPTENIRNELEEFHKSQAGKPAAQKGSLLDLFRFPNLRKKTCCMSYNWFVCGAAYFGVSQYVGELGGDIFFNVAFSGTLGVPGTIAAIFTGKYLGRRASLMISNTITGVAMLTIAFLAHDNETGKVICGSIGVFGMAMSFPIVYLFSGELYPTVVRNAGIGFSSMCARIGSMMAPFIQLTHRFHKPLPAIILGVIPLIGTFFCLFLPETKDTPLPETIEDGEAFGK